MNSKFLVIVFLIIFSTSGYSSDDHGHHEDHDHHEEKTNTHIDHAIAQQVGITTEQASSATLHTSATVYGQLMTGSDQLSHVRARFNGLIKSVYVSIGDKVNVGEVLAEVESNESLKNYKIVAPISGQIIQRHANSGEVTDDQILFSIVNLDTLWAELKIYPTLQSLVKTHQPVIISVNDQRVQSTITHLVPSLNDSYQVARLKIDNSKSQLAPGAFVQAEINTNEQRVSLAVRKNAIQTLNGESGVFTKHESNYEFASLVLGKSDDTFVEVLHGLNPGDEYVVDNSFLIKADIEKSTAEHDH